MQTLLLTIEIVGRRACSGVLKPHVSSVSLGFTVRLVWCLAALDFASHRSSIEEAQRNTATGAGFSPAASRHKMVD